MTTITQEEAFTFLHSILKIPNPQTQFSQLTKLKFLSLITNSWYKHVPFQNIDQIILTKTQKRAATIPEIISFHMKGRGGVCLYNAIFCHLLLSALNYSVHLVLGTVVLANDHAVVIARDVQTPGDSYLIEVGCGWPAFNPISLDSLSSDLSEATPIKDAFLEYTYVRVNDVLTRFHRKGDYVIHPNPEYKDGWRLHSQIELLPVPVEGLYSPEAGILKTLLDLEGGLMTSLLVILYSDGDCVSVTSNCLKFMENGELVKKEIKSKEEMIGIFQENFPMIDVLSVSDAWDITQSVVKSEK